MFPRKKNCRSLRQSFLKLTEKKMDTAKKDRSTERSFFDLIQRNAVSVVDASDSGHEVAEDLVVEAMG